MSEPQSDAAKRAAARKAKILARGNTGLQKLAQTARGDEAEVLYGSDSAASSRPTSLPIPASSDLKSDSQSQQSWAPPTSSTTSISTSNPTGSRRAPTGGRAPGLSPEQQQMQDQLSQMFGSLGGGAGGPAEGGMPDMSQLFAQMMGGLGDQSNQPNLLGDLDDPAGLGGLGGLPGFGGAGAGGGGLPPNLFGGEGMPSFPGMPGFGGGVAKRSKTDRYFPLVHFVAIFILAIFAVGWWEPSLRSAKSVKWAASLSWASRWAGLAGGRGVVRVIKDEVLGGIEPLPLFWAFTTLELILQTTRFMILKSPPPPHSLLSNFLPILPPAIARPLLTGSRYIHLLFQTYKDGALLVFLFGLTTVVARWQAVV